MSNSQTAQGNWNQVKGKIQEKWGDVTNDDLQKFEGQREQLIGMIQEKTGVAKEEIGKYISSISESATEFSKQAAETAREYRDVAAERAAEAAANARVSAEQMAGQISDQAQAGYIQAQRVVREKPAQSVAVCFGVGLLGRRRRWLGLAFPLKPLPQAPIVTTHDIQFLRSLNHGYRTTKRFTFRNRQQANE